MSAASSALELVPKRMSLFEHVAGVESIADLVDTLDRRNELTPELAEQLQAELITAIAGTKTKVDRCASVLAAFDAGQALALREADRLTKRAARLERQREALELTFLAVLAASDLPALDGETSTLARRKNPPKLVIDDARLIPEVFWKYPEAPPPPPAATPDNVAIKAALKTDPDAVPGARVIQEYRLVRS